jgi:hypothetical protein
MGGDCLSRSQGYQAMPLPSTSGSGGRIRTDTSARDSRACCHYTTPESRLRTYLRHATADDDKVPQMNTSGKGMNALLAAVCVALAALMLAAAAGAATVHFQKESVPAYEVELHHGEVHALTFHPGTTTGHLHVSLNNGGHMTVTYVASEQAKLVAAAQAAHARVKIATLQVKKTTAAKHKLRYIAGGILIIVIIVVLIVLLIGRRRAIMDDPAASSGESAAS